MSTAFSYKQTGTQELMAKLIEAPKKLRKTGLRKVANAGAKIVKAALLANAPFRTGTWKKSVGIKVVFFDDGKRVWFGVGPRSDFFSETVIDTSFLIHSASTQAYQHTGRKGNQVLKERGKRESVNIAANRQSIRPIKKSRVGKFGRSAIPEGTLCWFWRGKDGKIRAAPLRYKSRPVLYSHLIEKGTKFAKGLHFIAKTQKQTEANVEAIMLAVMQDVIDSM